MRLSHKPVRKCHSCLLNQGDKCWLYKYPRGQWRKDRQCPAFENEAIYAQFRESLKEPSILTRKEIRREFFRARKSPVIRRDTAPSWR
jgi:hypothetical protein